MADEQYAAYCYEYGYPPKQPQHLVAFAKKSGAKVGWKDARNIIKKAPNTSDYVPPKDKVKENKLNAPQTEQEIKKQKFATAKRYSSAHLDTTINQEKLAGRSKRSSALKYQYLVSQLTAMGFDYDASLTAIKACKGNLQLAIESLMSGDIIRPTNFIDRSRKNEIAQPSKPRSTSQKQYNSSKASSNNKNAMKYNDNNTAKDSNNTNITTSSSYNNKNSTKDSNNQNISTSNNYDNNSNNNYHNITTGTNYNNNSNNAMMSNSSSAHNNNNSKTQKPQANALQKWLNNIALGQYYHTFIEHNYLDRASLSNLTDDKLKAIGISLVAHRRTILKHINPSNSTQTKAQSTPSRRNTNANTIDDAFDKLLSGHASIKQRLNAMDEIYNNLDSMDVSSDNGKVLLSAYNDQIKHEDHIYNEFAVRIKAIQQIVDIFIFCLNRAHYNQIPDIIEQSLSQILDSLFMLLDNNRARKFHNMAMQCVEIIIDAVIGKNNTSAIVDLCGLLNEKINSEVITQAHARFFASKQVFDRLVFGYDVPFVHDMYEIDIHKYDNKLEKHTSGIPSNMMHMNEYPSNRKWIDLCVADQWKNDEDETFRDIVADCVSLMMLDPNQDIGIIGSNLAVYFYEFNHNFKDGLEIEAKYRFSKYPVAVTPKEPRTQLKAMKPVQNVQKENVDPNYNDGGAIEYRIDQETEVFIGGTTLPDL